MQPPKFISSRDNPQVQRVRKLARDAVAAREEGLIWIEGDHLARAAKARGWTPVQAWITEQAWDDPQLRDLAVCAPLVTMVPTGVFQSVSALESPSRIGWLLAYPEGARIDANAPSLVLDRVQDPGNVGSILRSASAFGFQQVLALTGTAALWSSKVLRAGMGAHFGLRLFEQLSIDDVSLLKSPWIGTSSYAQEVLGDASLPYPCTWLLGHEGQGLDERLLAGCARTVRIAQPGGEESLNVAVAAAICMHASAQGLRSSR